MPITWTAPPRVIAEGCERFSDALLEGLNVAMQEEAVAIAEDMRANAPWEDRTGDARAGLKAIVSSDGATVSITAGHSVFYGRFLELGTVHMRPFPIVNPTLEAHYASVMQRARALIGV